VTSPAGLIAIDIFGDTKGVDVLLDRLMVTLSPEGLAAFLGSTVEPYFRKRAAIRFRDEGDDVSGKWAPLLESTKEIRTQAGYGEGPINRRTGELEAFIEDSQSDVRVTPLGSILTMPGDTPTGELAEKVKTAQQGKDNPRTVPRPVLGMNEVDLAFVLEGLSFFIQDGKL
jgi:hypothetical protein